MDRVVRVRVLDSATRDRLAGEWRRAVSRPNWIIRIVFVVALLVVALPLLLLAGLAALAVAFVVGGLALLNGAAGSARRLMRGDGRSNVRVLRRSGEHA
jgi:uncharacterized membrane protein HdeD (DUF308 family)